jgi:indolepyruvate ferredoxin oxidoreductase beta subunit
MRFNMILAGVGGQGILSTASILAAAAMGSGFEVKQSEVHGMSQRGGSVVAHLRIADQPIASTLVPRGTADLVVASELLEAARQVSYLAPRGRLIVARTEVPVPEYPLSQTLIHALEANTTLTLLDAEQIARDCGSVRAATAVLLGAVWHLLPVRDEALVDAVRERFAGKSERIVEANLKALDAGRAAVSNGLTESRRHA